MKEDFANINHEHLLETVLWAVTILDRIVERWHGDERDKNTVYSVARALDPKTNRRLSHAEPELGN